MIHEYVWGHWIANMDPYVVQRVIPYDTELCLELNISIEIKYIKTYI
jgi:hypothetical protein